MSSDRTSEPRSAMIWDARDDIPRAGSSLEQLSLQDRAWTMLETYTVSPGNIRTRLSNAWLGDKGWRVQLVAHHRVRDEDWNTPLAAAARRLGYNTLLGTVVEPGELRASAVWRVPIHEDHISYFFGSHFIFFHMLFPDDLGFAVHANDGDYAAYAGPEAFLRDALPPDAIGAVATAEVKEGVEWEHGAGCLDAILAHYRPFMLE